MTCLGLVDGESLPPEKSFAQYLVRYWSLIWISLVQFVLQRDTYMIYRAICNLQFALDMANPAWCAVPTRSYPQLSDVRGGILLDAQGQN